MLVIDAHQELGVVAEADELELDAALGEAQARERDVEGRQQREDRKPEDDHDRGQDEHRPGHTIEPGGDRPPARGRQAKAVR